MKLIALFSLVVGILVIGWYFRKPTQMPTLPRPTIMASVTPSPKNCPTGYILVPGNPLYRTQDFCVMKYDAKCALKSDLRTGLKPANNDPCSGFSGGGSGTYKNSGTGCQCTGDKQVVSVKSGFPIAYIPEKDNTLENAVVYCQNIGGHLINNNEWMTMARNVETVAENWCDRNGTDCGNAPGTPGKILVNGHNDSHNEVSGSAGSNGALMAGEDSQPCFGTTSDGSNRCGGISSQKRTLTLTNSQVIWDMAGNVWAWVDAQVERKDQPVSRSGKIIDRGWIWSEFTPGALKTVITGNGTGPVLGYDAFRPSNQNWNSNQGVGRIYHYSQPGDADATVYTFIRGGNFRHGDDSGAFCIHLSPTADKTNINDVGFRCVI